MMMRIFASLVVAILGAALPTFADVGYDGKEEMVEVEGAGVTRNLLKSRDDAFAIIPKVQAMELYEAMSNSFSQPVSLNGVQGLVWFGTHDVLVPIPAVAVSPNDLDSLSMEENEGVTIIEGTYQGKFRITVQCRPNEDCEVFSDDDAGLLSLPDRRQLSSKSGKGGGCDPEDAIECIVCCIGFCFSGLSTVEEKEKGKMLMKDLKIGDKVLAANGQYQTVYSFAHRHESKPTLYLQIYTDSPLSKDPLEITREHLMFLVDNKNPVPASHVKIGDKLATQDEDIVTVTKIKSIVRDGLYAPITTDGTLVVNGALASSFVDFEHSDLLEIGGYKPFSSHLLGLMWEMPHRALCFGFGRKGVCENETYDENGYSTWSNVGMRIMDFVAQQNILIQMMLIVIAMSILIPLYAVGLTVTTPGVFASVIAVTAVWRLLLKKRFSPTSIKTVE